MVSGPALPPLAMGDRRESTLGLVESSDPRQAWLVRTVQNGYRGVVKVDRLKKFFASDECAEKLEANFDAIACEPKLKTPAN